MVYQRLISFTMSTIIKNKFTGNKTLEQTKILLFYVYRVMKNEAQSVLVYDALTWAAKEVGPVCCSSLP